MDAQAGIQFSTNLTQPAEDKKSDNRKDHATSRFTAPEAKAAICCHGTSTGHVENVAASTVCGWLLNGEDSEEVQGELLLPGQTMPGP